MSETSNRGTCPRCNRTVALRRDGRLRAHRPVPGSGALCPGSHRAATFQPDPEKENPSMATPDIAFVCVGSTTTPDKTFVAVRTADREAFVRSMFDPTEFDLWMVDFPGLAPVVADRLTASGSDVSILGTAADGEWTSWHPPVPAPAVPEVA